MSSMHIMHITTLSMVLILLCGSLCAGERFMSNYDKRMELAPRDVVARAIQDQMLTHSTPHVWLDISHKPAAEVASHFPNIAKRCAEDGIDITKDPIPVLPAQHYMCGGVATGLLGETSIQGLYACGEVACSGLHGANRLASNSLLEGLVFADRAVGPSVAHAEYAVKNCGRQLHYAAASADFRGPAAARPLGAMTAAWVAEKRQGLRTLMWRAAGITRRTRELESALQEIAGLNAEVSALYKSYGVAGELVELMNLVTVAELIVSCALQRRESRGLHFSADYPRIVPTEARASMIASSSFRSSRHDLDALVVSSAGGGVSTVKMRNGAATAGGGGGGKRASAAAGASPAPSAGGVSAGVGSRDLSVRSLPAEE
jgi:L-aspartate oxidase